MKKITAILCVSVVSALVLSIAHAQGLIVFRNDGKQVRLPYEEIDSIVTYSAFDGYIGFDGDNKEFTVNGVSFTMLPVQGGTYIMGGTEEEMEFYDPDRDGDEVPYPHEVTLSSFYMSETEVTQALWFAVMGHKPTPRGPQWSEDYGLGDSNAAYFISYSDCTEFLNRLNEITGIKFRFPTEAEWEYAARGGNMSKGYRYSGSNDKDDVTYGDSFSYPVKGKVPNELGIYDMGGNVYEWCSDWYAGYDDEFGGALNPTGPAFGNYRVTRGYFRICSRDWESPGCRENYLGMRLVAN